MADPVLDASTPCCSDFSRLKVVLPKCSTGSALAPGATGGLAKPATGTWSYTLNATGGGSGGGSGFSWTSSDPVTSEGWS